LLDLLAAALDLLALGGRLRRGGDLRPAPVEQRRLLVDRLRGPALPLGERLRLLVEPRSTHLDLRLARVELRCPRREQLCARPLRLDELVELTLELCLALRGRLQPGGLGGRLLHGRRHRPLALLECALPLAQILLR